MTRTLLHKGGPMNARVYRAEDADGAAWIEKDFSDCLWFVRNTVGRILVWRECWILRRLERETSVVPGGVRRLGPFALREDFLEGPTLRGCRQHRETPPRTFFEAFEAGVRAVHAAKFVHLDLHNSRNVMVAPGWRPVLIDWQSALPTGWMPGFLRRALERVDLAGVYKLWNKFRPDELDAERMRFLERSRFIRRHFWIPRVHPRGRA